MTGPGFSAVEIKSEGNVVDIVETLDFTGPYIIKDGTDVSINTLLEFGNKTIVGDLTVDGAIYGDGSYLTGVAAGAESDPVWASEKGDYYTAIEIDNANYLTSSVDLSAIDEGLYFTTDNVYPIGTRTSAPSIIFAHAFAGVETDRSLYGSTAMVGFGKFGTGITSVEAITAGTETVVPGTATLAVDGSIYTTTGTLGIGTATPGTTVDVAGKIRGFAFVPTAYSTLTSSVYSLTAANLSTADYFPVNTTGGAITATMYSDVGDNGIPATDVGRMIVFYITAGGTNALTIAADADLTLTTITAITAGGLTIEDVGDHADCFIATTDNIVCTTYEAD
jgi:hypothetical protein